MRDSKNRKKLIDGEGWSIESRTPNSPLHAAKVHKGGILMKRTLFIALLFTVVAGFVFADTQVGIVLPTKDEPRWIQDQTRFLDALKSAGFSAKVLFSQGDSAKEKANVEALISEKIKVLIICPQDGTAAAAAADLAHKAGLKI